MINVLLKQIKQLSKQDIGFAKKKKLMDIRHGDFPSPSNELGNSCWRLRTMDLANFLEGKEGGIR